MYEKEWVVSCNVGHADLSQELMLAIMRVLDCA